MRVVALACLLTGCAAIQGAALRDQSAAAMAQCNRQYPPGEPAIAVTRAACTGAALSILEPLMVRPELLRAFIADHASVAAEIQAGRMTIADGNAVIAAKQAELLDAEQTAEAQRQIATAALLQAVGQSLQAGANCGNLPAGQAFACGYSGGR